MVDKLIYKIDGLKAEFKDPDQIAVVTYLDEKLTEYRTVASTFIKAVEMIYEKREKCSGK